MRMKHTALLLTAGFLLMPTITLEPRPGQGGFGGPAQAAVAASVAVGGNGRPGGSPGSQPGACGRRTAGHGRGDSGAAARCEPDDLLRIRYRRTVDISAGGPAGNERMIQFAGPMLGLTGNTIALATSSAARANGVRYGSVPSSAARSVHPARVGGGGPGGAVTATAGWTRCSSVWTATRTAC